ncbi:MAG TPA: hypothetical protein VMA73_10820 [Streptosporangiaceae bacterium]|nr:hypothetical protein [Streptosporangiaceae bacterium]
MEGSPDVSVTSESQTNDFEDDPATAQRAVAAIGIIATALDGIANAGPSQPLTPTTTQRVFLLAYGWFASIVRTSELIALAHQNGLRHESAASSRVVLQHTLALQWLTEGGKPAADAVEADGKRRAHDLEKELTETGWPIPAGLTMQHSTKPAKVGTLEHQIDNFKAMCALYIGGDQLYVPYRLQSGYAHPSYVGAMAYLVPERAEMSSAAVTDTYAYLLDTTRCLIQAGRAFAKLLVDNHLTNEVAKAEKTLGIEFSLWQRLQ